MATLMETVKTDSQCTYGGGAGHLRPWEGSWESCRVSFHDNYDNAIVGNPNKDKAFFYVEKPPIQQSIDVVTEVEERLKVNPEERMKVYSANKEKTYCIERGEFWSDPVRFTLLSILLRDAHKNLKETLDSQTTKYVGSTRDALERFLDGNTFFHGDHYKGWVLQFYGKKPGEIDAMLKNIAGPPETVVEHHPGFTKRTLKLSRK